MQPAWCLHTHPASRSREDCGGAPRDRTRSSPGEKTREFDQHRLAVPLAYARERRGSNRGPLSADVGRAVRRGSCAARSRSGAFEGSRVNACSSGLATSSVTCGAPTTGRAQSAAAAARKTPPRPPSNQGLASRRPGGAAPCASPPGFCALQPALRALQPSFGHSGGTPCDSGLTGNATARDPRRGPNQVRAVRATRRSPQGAARHRPVSRR